MHLRRVLAFLIIGLIHSGCATVDHQLTISQRALQLNGKAVVVLSTPYELQTVQVMPGITNTLRVYIEGDGRAWARRNRPSSDPTPRSLLVLDLMEIDSHPDKAYIARPCQFIKNSACEVKVWTNLRYSKEAVVSLGKVLDILKAQGRFQKFELIGFSGGAALALLVAATRSDIASVRTIAGNLAPHYVNRLHKVSAMPNAISPTSRTNKLEIIPQLHFYGTDDPVIPPQVFTAYKEKFRDSQCISGHAVNGASHQRGWRKVWTTLLNQPLPSCSKVHEQP